MLHSLDVQAGERYKFVLGRHEFIAKFVKVKSNGDLVFSRDDGGRREHLRRGAFIRLRGIGQIVRLQDSETLDAPLSIEPAAFEPSRPGDSKSVAARKRRWHKAVTQKHYLDCIDEQGVSLSIPAIKRFIEQYESRRLELGLGKAPGASTLICLARECGSAGYRPLHSFLGVGGGDRRSNLWDPFILDLKAQMIELVYSSSDHTHLYAKRWFKGEVAKEQERRGPAWENALRVPPNSTLQSWIDRAATPENVRRRDGKAIANRQMEGVKPHLGALRPLECVVLDHTKIDTHIVVLDAEGNIEEIVRPWLVLVLDIFSRMVLAANLTLEPPSLYTLMEGLKQSVKPKPFLDHLVDSTAIGWAIL